MDDAKAREPAGCFCNVVGEDRVSLREQEREDIRISGEHSESASKILLCSTHAVLISTCGIKSRSTEELPKSGS